MQIIAEVLARGEQAIVLVPEIALTPFACGAVRFPLWGCSQRDAQPPFHGGRELTSGKRQGMAKFRL